MNMNSENYTPRDRIDRSLRERVLEEEDRRPENVRIPEVPALSQAFVSRCGCAGEAQQTPFRPESVPNPIPESPTVLPSDCGLRGRSLAMVYSPNQEFGDLYEVDEGLSCGTIFRRLNLPFHAAACDRKCFGNGGCRG